MLVSVGKSCPAYANAFRSDGSNNSQIIKKIVISEMFLINSLFHSIVSFMVTSNKKLMESSGTF